MKKVTDYLTLDEILAQLGEEAAELSHAALKLRRTLIDTNPTPVDFQTAANALVEEMADVSLCFGMVLDFKEMPFSDYKLVIEIMNQKEERWLKRLEEVRRKDEEFRAELKRKLRLFREKEEDPHGTV